ncbi:hypothetical protein [Algicella marina]|uniref:Uncharacterized protein n=1 Tax=Algicella marina TaxID=2683284 RepID=A0A6P1T0E4_9RHOB|nr:hypothetical protein [Algicella marina]QHQ35320.1 hypothetical protein GO499_08970 [Algicella marina]
MARRGGSSDKVIRPSTAPGSGLEAISSAPFPAGKTSGKARPERRPARKSSRAETVVPVLGGVVIVGGLLMFLVVDDLFEGESAAPQPAPEEALARAFGDLESGEEEVAETAAVDAEPETDEISILASAPEALLAPDEDTLFAQAVLPEGEVQPEKWWAEGDPGMVLADTAPDAAVIVTQTRPTAPNVLTSLALASWDGEAWEKVLNAWTTGPGPSIWDRTALPQALLTADAVYPYERTPEPVQVAALAPEELEATRAVTVETEAAEVEAEVAESDAAPDEAVIAAVEAPAVEAEQDVAEEAVVEDADDSIAVAAEAVADTGDAPDAAAEAELAPETGTEGEVAADDPVADPPAVAEIEVAAVVPDAAAEDAGDAAPEASEFIFDPESLVAVLGAAGLDSTAMQVMLHAPEGPAQDLAERVEKELRALELATVEMEEPTAFGPQATVVRYFHREDQALAMWLQAGLQQDALLSDLSAYRPQPPRGTVEVWLQP